MQAFNDQVYNFGLAKYLNAYELLSEHDDNDLGLADKPDVTLQASASDWLDITTGKVDSMLAFFLGKLTVTGNFILARKLRDLLPPTPVKN